MTVRITGYAYEADLHCPACTKGASQRMAVNNYHPHATPLGSSPASNRDQNGIHYNLTDREGNLIHAMFVTDEHPENPTCRDCGESLE